MNDQFDFILNSIDPVDNHYNFLADVECKYYSVDELNQSFDYNSHTFSILHFNIRSYLKNYDEFIALLSENKKYDIIVLTETWLKPHNVDLCKLSGCSFIIVYDVIKIKEESRFL